LNAFAVRAYGEAEFWLSSGKVLLIFIVFGFTFVTMVGGNPQHDAYGFSNWSIGHAFAQYRSAGALGRFEGFLAIMWNASFTIVGPEYISMAAAEAKHPRRYVKLAFKTIYLRFAIFFIGSAIAVGIIIPNTDPTLLAILAGDQGGSGTAAASPYVIAMKNMGITVLPSIVNALLLTSIFSAGNTYTYAATRALHGLSVQGRAPAIFQKCTKRGIPIYSLIVVLAFSLMALLQLSNGSAQVLIWLINLVTGSMLISYITMSITFLRFYRGCKVQGIDRSKLPYYGRFQPYCAIIGIVAQALIVFFYGYTSFSPFSVSSFFTYYTMVLLAPLLFIGWKLYKRTTWVRAVDMDLVWESAEITAYENSTDDVPKGLWAELLDMFRFKSLRQKMSQDKA
jgi:yeast amino acid transporter